MNRRELSESLISSIVSYALLRTLFQRQAFAASIKPLADPWLHGLHEMSRDLRGGALTDAYYLYYNDGTNKLRVAASYKDKPVATKAALKEAASKQDLALLAASFMDVYTHAWAGN